MRAAILILLISVAFYANAVSLPFKVNSVEMEREPSPHHVWNMMRSKEGDSKCKDEFHKKCGKEVDALKKAIENTSVMGIIKGSVDVASCIVNNLDDLFNHCIPKNEVVVNNKLRSENVVVQAKNTIASYEQLNMLNNNRFFVVGSDSNCKKQWEKDCGKQVEKLKKAVEDTSIVGIIAGAADVVECAIKNLEDIYNHCKSGNNNNKEEEKEDVILDIAPIPSNFGPIDQVNVCVGVVQTYCGGQLDMIRTMDVSAPFETQIALFKDLEVCIEENINRIESECNAASQWEFPQADVHSGCAHHRRIKHVVGKIALWSLFALFTIFMVKRCVRVMKGGKGCHGCCHAKQAAAAVTPVVVVANIDEVEKGQVYEPLVDQDVKN